MNWESAYKNTTKVKFGVGKKIVCKKCNKITETEATTERQKIGNCYQAITKCLNCGNYFVDSWV